MRLSGDLLNGSLELVLAWLIENWNQDLIMYFSYIHIEMSMASSNYSIPGGQWTRPPSYCNVKRAAFLKIINRILMLQMFQTNKWITTFKKKKNQKKLSHLCDKLIFENGPFHKPSGNISIFDSMDILRSVPRSSWKKDTWV